MCIRDSAEPDGGEEEYLELFMAHSMEESGDFHEVMSSGSSGAGIEMKYSRFVSSYQPVSYTHLAVYKRQVPHMDADVV